jgi:hypothetical protein
MGERDIYRLPIDATLLVICSAHWRTLENQPGRGMFLLLHHPAGHEVARQPLIIPPEASLPTENSRYWISAILAKFDVEGIWNLQVRSGGFLLAEVEVKF